MHFACVVAIISNIDDICGVEHNMTDIMVVGWKVMSVYGGWLGLCNKSVSVYGGS